jgi:hypothetical protein
MKPTGEREREEGDLYLVSHRTQSHLERGYVVCRGPGRAQSSSGSGKLKQDVRVS